MIAVFGAGAIGCYVGGMLASAGERVAFIGRESTARALADGLTVEPMGKAARQVEPSRFTVATGPEGLAGATTVLVCVKSQDTAEAAQTIVAHAPLNALVVSLQNGLGNVETLAAAVGGARAAAAVVAFNVVRPQEATFRQTTEGGIVLAPAAQELVLALDRAGIEAETHGNMVGVQWSKLILNLNNALNALGGVPLREQLLDRDWRRLMADTGAEAMEVARAGGVRLERISGVPPWVVPHVLRLPTPAFRIVAGALLKIDPDARTSMAQDLEAGKDSEIAWLNGAVTKEGRRWHVRTPVNDAVIALTEEAFARGQSPRLSGRAAREAVAERSA
jgi:2-dehydropantoate 2-reductase